jgi:hypothetical protein
MEVTGQTRENVGEIDATDVDLTRYIRSHPLEEPQIGCDSQLVRFATTSRDLQKN